MLYLREREVAVSIVVYNAQPIFHSTSAFVPPVRRSILMVSQGNSQLDRGIAFKVEGRYEEAVTELREFLEQDPNSGDGHHQLGLVYGFIGLFDESIEELQKAVLLTPARVDPRVDFGADVFHARRVRAGQIGV